MILTIKRALFPLEKAERSLKDLKSLPDSILQAVQATGLDYAKNGNEQSSEKVSALIKRLREFNCELKKITNFNAFADEGSIPELLVAYANLLKKDIQIPYSEKSELFKKLENDISQLFHTSLDSNCKEGNKNTKSIISRMWYVSIRTLFQSIENSIIFDEQEMQLKKSSYISDEEEMQLKESS